MSSLIAAEQLEQRRHHRPADRAHGGDMEQDADRMADSALAGQTRSIPAIDATRGTAGRSSPTTVAWLPSPGQPLAGLRRADLEARFHHDLGHVRLHTTPQSGELATGLRARAFTYGSHIVFGHGEFAPDSRRGARVLAHEMAHVVQQSGVVPAVARADPSQCATDCEMEDGKGKATGTFSLTVLADREGPFLLLPLTHKVGHSWVRLEDDQGRYWTFGFWPQTFYDASDTSKDVAGCVHHPDTAHEASASQRFDLNPAEFAKAFNFAKDYCRKKPKYNLFGLQCTEFVRRALAAAGKAPAGGFGLIWESPNALHSWIRTHSLVLGTSLTAATSAEGGRGAGAFGANAAYHHQFYSLLGTKLRLYGYGRGEVSSQFSALSTGVGVELNPQKVWLPAPYIEGGGVLGDLSLQPGQSRFGAGPTASAGVRFNIDQLAVVGVEYSVVKDVVNADPVLHRMMITAGIRLF